jgi:hypothetical protein
VATLLYVLARVLHTQGELAGALDRLERVLQMEA